MKEVCKYSKVYDTKWYDISTLNAKSTWLLLGIGVFIGFINGFWGGGGGMICVPSLTYVVGLEEKKAHATTILIMLPLSFASFVMYWINGYFDLDKTWTTGIGFVVGGLIGAYILKKINNTILKLIFSLIILAGAVWIII